MKKLIHPAWALTWFIPLLLTLAASDSPRQHSVVLLTPTPLFTRLNPSSYNYGGISILSCSSSTNAPSFPAAIFNQDGTVTQSIPIAQALADLLNQGYKLQFHDNLIVAIK